MNPDIFEIYSFAFYLGTYHRFPYLSVKDF